MCEMTDELYNAILRHDNKFDGRFYIGILTTGIVCFPSCRSRTPKRENIRVYLSLEEAIRSGFRPCKRCKPDSPSRLSPDSEVVHQVLEIIHHRFQEPITLRTLSNELNMSPYHLQRTYKRVTGISPAKQLQSVRIDEAKRLLQIAEKSIGEVAMDVGFRSLSHFSDTFRREIGMSPLEYRKNE